MAGTLLAAVLPVAASGAMGFHADAFDVRARTGTALVVTHEPVAAPGEVQIVISNAQSAPATSLDGNPLRVLRPAAAVVPVPVMKPLGRPCATIELAAAVTGPAALAADTPPLPPDGAAGARYDLEVVAVEIARREIGRLEIEWRPRSPGTTISLGLVGEPRAEASADPVDRLGRELARQWSKTERRLQLLQRQGNLQVLARERLPGTSGEAARFQASSRLLMPVSNADNTMAIGFEELGVALDVLTTTQKGPLLDIQLRSNVSSVMRDGGIMLEGFRIPVVTTSSNQVAIEMAKGQTLAVTNLFPRGTVNDADLFPVLAEVPVVGRLFESRRFRRGETELLLLITPQAIRPALETEQMVACESSASVP
jgi:pilus assembly protein CpaC